MMLVAVVIICNGCHYKTAVMFVVVYTEQSSVLVPRSRPYRRPRDRDRKRSASASPDLGRSKIRFVAFDFIIIIYNTNSTIILIIIVIIIIHNFRVCITQVKLLRRSK